MSDFNVLGKKKVILFDEASGSIDFESNADSLTSMLIWKDENKRRSQLKKTNALLVGRYGEKMSIFQNAMIRVAKELSPIETRVFLILLGICDFENFIKVGQPEIAKELGEHVPHISSALKSLREKEYIEVYKHGRQNYYRINPAMAWKGSYDSWKKEIDMTEFRNKKKKDEEKTKEINDLINNLDLENSND